MRKNPGKTLTGEQTGEKPPETFTKERVNELMQKRIERSHQAFFNRYGVKDLKGLDDLFGRAESVDGLNAKIEELAKSGADLQSRYDELATRHKDLTKEYALRNRNIRPEIKADIEAYFKGKGLEIDDSTLGEELKTHADWAAKASTVVPLGNESERLPDAGERELASRLLGVDL